MKTYQNFTFQDRSTQAAEAKQRKLDLLAAKKPLDPAAQEARLLASQKREAAHIDRRAIRKAAQKAAALAARNHTERQLRAVTAALEEFTASAGHPAHAMKSDFEFHRAVAAASGNPYYSDCLAALGQTMIAMPRTRLMTGVEHYARDHFDQVVQEHRSISEAIADGDAAAAAAAMRSHLANSRRRFKASARP